MSRDDLRLAIDRYLAYKAGAGVTAETLAQYKRVLDRLSANHSDKKLSDFEPPSGTELLRLFTA